jgi:hypothetical protein
MRVTTGVGAGAGRHQIHPVDAATTGADAMTVRAFCF